MADFIFVAVALFYAFCTICLAWYWHRIPAMVTKAATPLPRISVVVAARNEANNLPALLQDLQQQTCPGFEVIVVDDHSKDNTARVVQDFMSKACFPLRLLQLQGNSPGGKKQAITLAVKQSTGQLLVTTDADCRVSQHWLQTICDFQASTGAVLVSGPVCYHPASSFFGKLQSVEFLSLVGSGAASMQAGQPNMCNGANLAWLKAAFGEVGGFEGSAHIASGDDEFLMHKIASQYPGRVLFLKSGAAAVATAPAPDLYSFYQQRKRWGGKWRHYQQLAPQLVAMLVFAFHFCFCSSFLLFASGGLAAGAMAGGWLLKILAELVFLVPLLVFFRKKKEIPLIFLLVILHPFYIVVMGVAATMGNYNWKGRPHQRRKAGPYPVLKDTEAR